MKGEFGEFPEATPSLDNLYYEPRQQRLLNGGATIKFHGEASLWEGWLGFLRKMVIKRRSNPIIIGIARLDFKIDLLIEQVVWSTTKSVSSGKPPQSDVVSLTLISKIPKLTCREMENGDGVFFDHVEFHIGYYLSIVTLL